MDGGFKEIEKMMNERFWKVNLRFDKVESEIRDFKVHLENAVAITRNGRLVRMHQPINLIRVRQPGRDPNTLVWASHPKVPKHMKKIYTFG